MHCLAALGAIVLSALVSGCTSGDIIDPSVEIPEKRSLVVVPFRDPEYDNGFDSPRGSDLATRVTKLLKEKAEFRVKSVDVVIQLYEEGNARNLTAKEVAQKTGADYVLMGDVVRWRLADENTFGLKRGTSSIDVSLYETYDAANERIKDDKDREDLPKPGRGRLALAKRRVSASFPNEYGMKDIGTYDMSDDQIETGLLNSSAIQVAWLLIPHTKDEEKLMGGGK
jgi:hypothetical protein